MQQAIQSGDLAQMRAVAAEAAQQVSNPEVAALLPSLHAAIASHERTVGVIPPYGVAIHQAIASGDVGAMKQAEANAHRHLGEIQSALNALRGELGRHGGGPVVVPLYAATIQEATASGDLARMRSVAAQADAMPDKTPDVQQALSELKGHIAKAQG